MTDQPIPESYWVLPGQFLAGGYPASTRGEAAVTRQRLTALLNEGFDTFFDLTRPGELTAYLPDLQVEAEGYEQTIDYRRFSVGDLGLPSRAQMIELLEAIDAALASGRKVYLHCWGGIGRTGTTVGCWLVRHGLEGEAALARLAELYHTAAQSRWYPNSPETDAQRAFIREWNAS